MKVSAIGLLSGGLDGILAVKVLQEQGVHVKGVTFETPFFNAGKARETAHRGQTRLETFTYATFISRDCLLPSSETGEYFRSALSAWNLLAFRDKLD